MKNIIILLLIISSLHAEGYGPYGNVKIYDGTPYVIISDQKIITRLYEQLALSSYSLNKGRASITLAPEKSEHKDQMGLSYYSLRSGVDLIPIISSQEGYDAVLGFWPGKEIVCETVTKSNDNPRVYLTVGKLFLFHGKQVDRILVECEPLPMSQMEKIQSKNSTSLACLGYFSREYPKFYKKIDGTIPDVVLNNFSALESKYLGGSKSNGTIQNSQNSDIAAFSVQGKGYKNETLYIGVFSSGEKSVKGFLVVLNPAGELLAIRKGFTQLLGISDINRNWVSEFLLFWGSGYGGGVELIEPDVVNGEFQLNSLHRLDTVWD